MFLTVLSLFTFLFLFLFHFKLTRYYGGWVAKNIYYLGAAGVVNVVVNDNTAINTSINRPSNNNNNNNIVRIAGLSGIYKEYHFRKGEILMLMLFLFMTHSACFFYFRAL